MTIVPKVAAVTAAIFWGFTYTVTTQLLRPDLMVVSQGGARLDVIGVIAALGATLLHRWGKMGPLLSEMIVVGGKAFHRRFDYGGLSPKP